MHAGRILFGLIAAAAVTPSARAQQATPTPAPPTIITLPDTGTGTFSIAPRATPAPTPTPIVTPTPVELPPAAASAPVQRRPASPPAVTQTPAATPAAATTAEPAPVSVPTPVATATPLPAAPVAAPHRPWLWALLGAAMTALAGLAAWLMLRRRRPVEAEAEVEEAAPIAVLPPAAPPPPRVASAPIAPPQSEPFELGVRPLALQLGEREIVLDIEMLIANLTANSADAVRLAAVMISANADQDAQIAAFQANSQLIQATAPFDLEAGGGGRMPIRLTLPREHVQVVTVSGRPMFVPLVMIGIHWRGGLAVRRFGASFMIGTGGQGSKLGPIWLDRPAPRGLAATRYFRREAVAA